MDRPADTKRRLRVFLLGSAMAHVLILTGWSLSARFGGHPQTVLSVRLDAEGSRARPSVARLAEASTGARAVPSGQRVENRILASEAPNPDMRVSSGAISRTGKPSTRPEDDGTAESLAQRAAHDAVAAAGSDTTDENARARIQARLYADLARHFDYPWIARARGWQGNVLLGVIVQASGRLDAIRVVRSSGFAVLDRSAVDSLKKVERIPEAVAWLQGRDLEMRLPIVYRLEGER